jgi:hypothetical protein
MKRKYKFMSAVMKAIHGRMLRGALIAAVSSLVLISGIAAAQLAGKGGVSGIVQDPSGAAVPNATIVITKVDTGIATTTTSTSSGDFNVSTLDPGLYTIVVMAPGFEKLTQQNVQVNTLEVVTYNPKLTIGATTDSVTVSTLPPQLETTNATLGATMENEMYAALPIEMGAYGQADQRRATDFAFLMPGVQGNNTNGNPTTNAGIVNGSGSRGAVSAIYLDGVVFVRAGGNGDPRYVWTAISVDAVDQFQLQTNGYSAMYEGQGIQNYTIKQGGSKYHGGVYEFFRNTALDTWGFFGANATNPATGLPQKPIEHSNEYGINISGPLVPFGTWKDKLFFFGNYNGFRYASETPTAITFPTVAEQQGNFAGLQTGGIWDPLTQATCTANSTNGPCRYRYGYGPGVGTGKAGNPVIIGPVDVIPASEFSKVALNLQSLIPTLSNQNAQNNFNANNRTGLVNWSHTERIDYTISPKDTLTLTSAIGRQASSVPVGQTTTGRNVGPVPYNYGQAYAPKTAVGIIEETHTFTPHLVNQIKYGFARYNGPTFNADFSSKYGAATLGGIANLPAGQAAGAFPIVSFAGTNAPTQWAGTTASVTIAQNFTLVDNVQWTKGNHTLTIGGQIAWLQYLNQPATTGETQLQLATAVTETAQINSAGAAGSYSVAANTGLSYASFLVGEIDKGNSSNAALTQYAVQEFASRFRAISPYIQDNWKVSNKLTLDLGLRWDYFPTVHEVSDNISFFNPNLANPVTGVNGALQFAGNGTNTCNCDTPANNFYKNFGPRFGMAYQLDDKTVIRGSYGVMFTHGNGVGGGTASSLGGANVSLGFSVSPTFAATGQDQGGLLFLGTNTAFPTFNPAPGRAAGPAYGTGYTTNSPAAAQCGSTACTGAPSAVAYLDPYLGSRAPEYENWSFGFQHQWTQTFASTITYVGSQGHFLIADGSNARGYYADQLDPKYTALGTNLTLTGANLTTYCANNAGVCPASLSVFNTGQNLAQLLKPFPFHGVADYFANVSNANYHALQTSFNMRPSHGVTFMANYTWSRSIDDGGTFRSGYALTAAETNTSHDWAQDRIERTVSTSNQPHHVVVTAVWDLPIGKSILASNEYERAILGGFKFSTIFQAYSGSPLAITGSTCPANPAQSTCMPSYNPTYGSNTARINGKWGQGVTRGNYSQTGVTSNQFINTAAFSTSYTPYTFGNLPRTAAYNIYGPGNYQLDLALVRSFKLHITETSRFDFRAEWYNVTNKTFFAVASTVFGNSSFGQVAPNASATRKAAQLSARLNF